MQLILRLNEIFYEKFGTQWKKKLQIWMSIVINHGYG
jgi:hypothetical protein